MTTGSRVVCVDDEFPLEASKHYICFPKAGVVYTIRNVELGCNWQGEPGEVAVLLREIVNPKSSKAPFRERAFNAERFRPLEALTETDVEAMRKGDLVAV